MHIPESMQRDFEEYEFLRNGCEQALLLLERDRFKLDTEARVVKAVLKAALAQNTGTSHEA